MDDEEREEFRVNERERTRRTSRHAEHAPRRERTGGVDPREERGGVDGGLGPLLLPALEPVEPVRVPQRPLDQGDVHLCGDVPDHRARLGAVPVHEVELSDGEPVEHVEVDLGRPHQVGPLRAARLEVDAPLVGELVQEPAVGEAVPPLEGAGVVALQKCALREWEVIREEGTATWTI